VNPAISDVANQVPTRHRQRSCNQAAETDQPELTPSKPIMAEGLASFLTTPRTHTGCWLSGARLASPPMVNHLRQTVDRSIGLGRCLLVM